MTDRAALVGEKIRAVLLDLSEEERRLLSEVVRVERGYLHQREPLKAVVNKELLDALREVIK